MAFQVVFRPRALSDITAAVTWMTKTSPAAAAQWRMGFFRIVQNLEVNPARYAEAEEAHDIGMDLRELLYGRRQSVYRILFSIDEQSVNVHRVRRAAQDRLASGDI